jgi:ribosomal-protein-alanine N-acetyltransferase
VRVELRQVTVADAAVLAGLYRSNRTFLAPWEPARDEAFFTEDGQRRLLAEAQEGRRRGQAVPCLVLADDRVVGRVTITDIVRGAFHSAHLGYWVAEEMNGRGIATGAVAAALRLCFEDLGLHRVQAATLTHNAASQRVLTRNGFSFIGTAPQYLRIAGRWQDHHLYQRVEDRWRPPGS